MKQVIITLKVIAILAAIGFGAHMVTAVFVPGSTTPPSALPERFIDVSGDGQAKQGWLAIGTSSAPLATLDVVGTVVTNTLGVIGDGWITGNMRVGGSVPPLSGDPKLVVDGSRIRSSILAGTGDRPVCSDADGLLKICGSSSVPPPLSVDFCSNLAGDQATLPVTVGGVMYNDTDGDGICSPSSVSIPPPVTDSPTNCYIQISSPSHEYLTCNPISYAGAAILQYTIQEYNPDIATPGYTWRNWGVVTYTSDSSFPTMISGGSSIPRINVYADGAVPGATLVPSSGRTCTAVSPSPATFPGCAFRIKASSSGMVGIGFPGTYSLGMSRFNPVFPFGSVITTAVSGSNTIFTWPKPENEHISSGSAFIRKVLERCAPAGGGSVTCSLIAETRNATTITVPTSSFGALSGGAYVRMRLYNTLNSPSGAMTDEITN